MKQSMKQLLRRPGKTLLFFLLTISATMLLVFGTVMYAQNEMRMGALDKAFSTMVTAEQRLPTEYLSTGGECFPYRSWQTRNDDLRITPEQLNVDGVEYIVPPEQRPYYLAYLPEATVAVQPTYYDLLEVEALGSSPDGGEVPVRITRVFLEKQSKEHEKYFGNSTQQTEIATGEYIQDENGNFKPIMTTNYMDVGWETTLCQHGLENAVPIEAGKKYIGYFMRGNDELSALNINSGMVLNVAEAEYLEEMYAKYSGVTKSELSPFIGPFSSQYDSHGKKLSSVFPAGLSGSPLRLEEVTEGFYDEGGSGEYWMDLLEQEEKKTQLFPVLPVTDPRLVPSFREGNVRVTGRMITDEEYEQGAKVCMVSQAFAAKNTLHTGEKIKLPLLCSMYGYRPTQDVGDLWQSGSTLRRWFTFPRDCSLLNAQGELYEPFWEEEYEIVGIYRVNYDKGDLAFNNMFVIPKNSVEASDENNIAYFGAMDDMQTSFQIKNGSIETFEQRLREAAPEVAEQLTLRYDDMGYANARENLESARKTALLLLIVGAVATAAIVALLLYFFVVREKKRTAIERSLGMTKRQCRVSLLSGILVLTLIASVIGSGAAYVVFGAVESRERSREITAVAEETEDVESAESTEDTESTGSVESTEVTESVEDGTSVQIRNFDLGGLYHFSASYSPWAMWDVKGSQAKLDDVTAPPVLYLAAPLLLTLLVAVLALFLIDRNLRIEPIYLLSGKLE